MNPYSRYMKPEFQSPEVKLPQWVPMGDNGSEQSGANMGSIASLMKQKMGGGNPSVPMGQRDIHPVSGAMPEVGGVDINPNPVDVSGMGAPPALERGMQSL